MSQLFVVAIVDLNPRPWPSWQSLVEHGMDRDMAHEWAIIRHLYTPRVLRLLLGERRN